MTARLFHQGFGLAIQNALSHRQLQRVAALDALTGAYNQHFGLKRLNEEFNRAIRAKSHLALILFDIDHFKRVNDTYGHLVGDRVIVAVTEGAHQSLRDGDILMRYGGEEFCAILPGVSPKNAAVISERIRHVIEGSVVEEGKQHISVTIGAGVAVYPNQMAEKPSELLDMADKKLYRAKHEGRNRVVL